MLVAMTVLAVLCGVVAWCGLSGLWGFVMIVVILATAAGAFVGLLICSYAGFGFGFGDLASDALKCVALGAISVLLFHGLISLSPPGVLIVPLVVAACMKLFWIELTGVEIVIVGFSGVCGASMAWGIASYWMAS